MKKTSSSRRQFIVSVNQSLEVRSHSMLQVWKSLSSGIVTVCCLPMGSLQMPPSGCWQCVVAYAVIAPLTRSIMSSSPQSGQSVPWRTASPSVQKAGQMPFFPLPGLAPVRNDACILNLAPGSAIQEPLDSIRDEVHEPSEPMTGTSCTVPEPES